MNHYVNGMARFIRHLTERAAKGELPLDELNEIVDAISGERESERVHDVTSYYVACLYALDQDAVAECIDKVDLIFASNEMGLAIKGTLQKKGDFDPDNPTEIQDDAMLKALRGVLRGGGIEADIDEAGTGIKIRVSEEGADPYEEAINAFRRELDEIDDPVSKWLKPKGKEES